jgi:hypothetical protein
VDPGFRREARREHLLVKLVPGRYQGQIWISPNCFEPMSEEELDLWERWER